MIYERRRGAARAGGKPLSGGSTMGENVTLVRAGAVATVTLNRPDRRNSLSDAMLSELGAAFAELRDDATTRVVIVTGAPPVFSAGADAPHAQATICSINGHAVGGGWGLTLACDFRIAAAAAELWIPEVDLGVPLGIASTTRFVRMVGPARAKEILMSCRRYSAAEAHAMGLVHQVVPAADLARAVADYADMLSKKPTRPLAEMKARINTVARVAVPEVNAMTEGFLDRN